MSELKEALDASGASALVPKIIDPMLLEYQRRYSPLVRAIESFKWDSTVYYFNQRTGRVQGGFTTDGGSRPVSTSTYTQKNFTIRNMQAVGAITGYAQQVTKGVIGDLRAAEIEGTVQGLYWDVETAMLWGNEGATSLGAYPQFSGLDTLVSDFTTSSKNALDQAGGTLTLAYLDQLIDMVESNAAMAVADPSWMLVMSSTANSKVAQLLTSQQRFEGMTEVAAGLNVPTYRGVPIIKSSFLSGRATTMGTLTGATAATGGTLAQNTAYKYQVTAVIARQGEIAASAELSQTTGNTTATNTITLSFSTPTGLDSAQPILYKVYRTAGGGATGSAVLLGVVDAVVGLGADGVTPVLTTSIVDDGTTLTPKNGATAPTNNPAAYQGGNSSMKPPATGSENIYLLSRDRNFVCRPYVRELEPIDLYATTTSPDQMPFALVSDTALAIRGQKYCGRLARVNTSL